MRQNPSCRFASGLPLHLRQHLLEVVPATNRFEVWLLQLVVLASAGVDGVAQRGNGLVGEGGGLGGGHAGVPLRCQPG
jgi:hypothetical protein